MSSVLWTLNAANFDCILWALLTRHHSTMAPNTAALTPFFRPSPHFSSWSTTCKTILNGHSLAKASNLNFRASSMVDLFRSLSALVIVSEITGTMSRTAISHRRRPVSFWRSARYLQLSGWNVSMEVEKSWAEGLNNLACSERQKRQIKSSTSLGAGITSLVGTKSSILSGF